MTRTPEHGEITSPEQPPSGSPEADAETSRTEFTGRGAEHQEQPDPTPRVEVGEPEVPGAAEHAPESRAEQAPVTGDMTEADADPLAGTPTEAEDEIQPLEPPDPVDEDQLNLFHTPPPLPQPMLVLDGDLPEPEPEPEPVDHGTCTCGGAFDADGWCTECGNPKPDPRHHYTIQESVDVAGACDRGLRHSSNEDALALWADPEHPGRAAVVVCDGVTTATRSAEASQAAVDAAIQVLAAGDAGGGPELLVAATDAAAAAVNQVGEDFPDSAPSCTFVAAQVDGGVATVGSVGDSRGYWIPDNGEAARLTSDDSMAEEQIRAGVDRASAESGPLAHTITRWLGPDAPDHTPVVVTQDVSAAGWLVLCSDGLWNYASEPDELAAVVRAQSRQVDDDALELARALVGWANDQGGADNITVGLVRTGSRSGPPETADPPVAADADVTGQNGQDGTHG